MDNMNKRFESVGIITFPISKSGCTPTGNIIQIFRQFADRVILITGNEGCSHFKNDSQLIVFGYQHNQPKNFISRIFHYAWIQALITITIIRKLRGVPFLVFFIADDLVLPLTMAKILRKKVLIVSAGSLSFSMQSSNDPFYKIILFIVKLNYYFADKIVLYSPKLISEWGLERYQKKIVIATKHFIDIQKYSFATFPTPKKIQIGYLGRLSDEKGVMNLIFSAKQICENRDDIQFIIAGDGYLREKIEQFIAQNGLNKKIHLIGWIPHEDTSFFLQSLKLLVIPSYTEGLPNALLEAMACGIPVLATPVGAIPDFIKDGKTGFIMKSNVPSCITKNIIRCIENENFDTVAKNARGLIEREFTFEVTIIKWDKLISELA